MFRPCGGGWSTNVYYYYRLPVVLQYNLLGVPGTIVQFTQVSTCTCTGMTYILYGSY